MTAQTPSTINVTTDVADDFGLAFVIACAIGIGDGLGEAAARKRAETLRPLSAAAFRSLSEAMKGETLANVFSMSQRPPVVNYRRSVRIAVAAGLSEGDSYAAAARALPEAHTTWIAAGCPEP